MRISLSPLLQRIKSPYGMRNWAAFREVSDLNLKECMELIKYLKEQADIPLEQNIWDEEKVLALVALTKRRKLLYFVVWAAIILSGIIAVIVLMLGFACIYSGITCTSNPLMKRINISFLAASLVTIGLLWIKTHLSRDRRQLQIMDYLASDLSTIQKRNLLNVFNELKEENRQLYIAGNYDVLRSVPRISWTAENWFLLFTENERHRFAIWLDGRYPVGRFFVRVTKRAVKKTGTVWDKVKLPNTKLLFSQKEQLMQAVKDSGELDLNPHQKVWREGLVILAKNYDEYLKYLEKTLDSAERKLFLSKFVPIFAVLSKNYKYQLDAIGKENIDLDELGASGATKFLRGTNENIDKWLETIMPR